MGVPTIHIHTHIHSTLYLLLIQLLETNSNKSLACILGATVHNHNVLQAGAGGVLPVQGWPGLCGQERQLGANNQVEETREDREG